MDADLNDWKTTIDTNFIGTLQLTKAVVPAMKELGEGRIVMINTQSSLWAKPNYGAYAGSKAALAFVTKTLARELGRFGIRVNGDPPGLHLGRLRPRLPRTHRRHTWRAVSTGLRRSRRRDVPRLPARLRRNFGLGAVPRLRPRPPRHRPILRRQLRTRCLNLMPSGPRLRFALAPAGAGFIRSQTCARSLRSFSSVSPGRRGSDAVGPRLRFALAPAGAGFIRSQTCACSLRSFSSVSPGRRGSDAVGPRLRFALAPAGAGFIRSQTCARSLRSFSSVSPGRRGSDAVEPRLRLRFRFASTGRKP